MRDIDLVRHRFMAALVVYLWLHVPVVGLAGWAIGAAFWPVAGLVVAAALVGTAAWRFAGNTPAGRQTMAVATIAMPMAMVLLFAGHPWQLDLHMYFFATIALLAVLVDPVALLLAAAATAVHHLGLNFILPALVFPGGADLGRVLLHALIVVIETAALFWWARRTLHLALSRDAAEAAAAAAQAELVGANAAIAGELDAQSAAVARELAERAQILDASAAQLVDGQTTALASVEAVESAGERAAADVQTVAAAAEQLSRAIDAVATRVESSNASGRQAVERVAVTSRTMASLDHAAQSIGEILAMVSDIAAQTNLLALNATIEAARAGEAGKGFAVVASEVKHLAEQTTRATDDIARQVETIQGVARASVASVGDIRAAIDDLAAIAEAVQEAVREQADATDAIAAATRSAAAATNDSREALGTVHERVAAVSAAAATVRDASAGIASQSVAMRDVIDAVVTRLRSA